MASIKDFRTLIFNSDNIKKSGNFIGRIAYPKLFFIENCFRIIIHSILSVQISPTWWDIAVSQTIKDKAIRFKQQYIKKTWHSKPGSHDIYYIDLKDLNEIIRANRNLFDRIIPDLDKWIIDIEDIKIPRNIVAHMNFPLEVDQKRIDVFYNDCQELLLIIVSRINIIIP